jgi:hypothetical protein
MRRCPGCTRLAWVTTSQSAVRDFYSHDRFRSGHMFTVRFQPDADPVVRDTGTLTGSSSHNLGDAHLGSFWVARAKFSPGCMGKWQAVT